MITWRNIHATLAQLDGWDWFLMLLCVACAVALGIQGAFITCALLGVLLFQWIMIRMLLLFIRQETVRYQGIFDRMVNTIYRMEQERNGGTTSDD